MKRKRKGSSSPDATVESPPPAPPASQRGESASSGKMPERNTEGSPKYKCRFCGKGFTTPQAIGGHTNLHREERDDELRQAMASIGHDPRGHAGASSSTSPRAIPNAGPCSLPQQWNPHSEAFFNSIPNLDTFFLRIETDEIAGPTVHRRNQNPPATVSMISERAYAATSLQTLLHLGPTTGNQNPVQPLQGEGGLALAAADTEAVVKNVNEEENAETIRNHSFQRNLGIGGSGSSHAEGRSSSQQ